MNARHPLVWAGLLALGLPPLTARAADMPEVDFARDILPALQRSCVECHGPEKQKGKLRLDSRAAALRGGRNGPALVPGKAAESELYRRVSRPKGDDGVMPERGEPLPAAQVTLLRRWIDAGAAWPDNAQVARHWAYVKPARPALPTLKDPGWTRNPVDHFILAPGPAHQNLAFATTFSR